MPLDILCMAMIFQRTLNSFFNPNTTPIIRHMDQGIISTFKSYYLRRVLKLLLSKTDGNEELTMFTLRKTLTFLRLLN
jgi:hypothetical protein